MYTAGVIDQGDLDTDPESVAGTSNGASHQTGTSLLRISLELHRDGEK